MGGCGHPLDTVHLDPAELQEDPLQTNRQLNTQMMGTRVVVKYNWSSTQILQVLWIKYKYKYFAFPAIKYSSTSSTDTSSTSTSTYFNPDIIILVPPNLLMQCIALAYTHLSINQVE